MTTSELSTKPYLIRAIYEWCADSGLTPYLGVKVDEHTRVPMEYVKNGEIVLSIAMQATRDLTIGNEMIQFSARFNGVSREIAVPMHAVHSVFARENGRGVFFDPESPPEHEEGHANASRPVAVAPLPAPAVAHVVPTLQAVPNTSTSTSHAAQDNAENSAENGDSADTAAPQIDADSPDKPKGPPRGNLRIIK
jgi:stringent starvation protein B